LAATLLTGVAFAEAEVQRVLVTLNQVFVFQIPPQTSAAGHRYIAHCCTTCILVSRFLSVRHRFCHQSGLVAQHTILDRPLAGLFRRR
jgi:hypothetical protein